MRNWILALLLLSAGATAALAQDLTLGWDDAVSRGGTTNRLFDCNTNDGSNTFVLTFVPPVDLPGVIELDVTLFFEMGQPVNCDPFGGPACLPPPLVAWWDFRTGAARQGDLLTSIDFTAEPWGSSTTVESPWFGAAFTVLPYQVESITNGVDTSTRGRLDVQIVPLSGAPVDLLAGHEYYVVRGTVLNQGVATCAGCCDPALILPGQVRVSLTTGAIATLGTPTGPLAWQAFRTGGCLATPAHTPTWGALKSRYR